MCRTRWLDCRGTIAGIWWYVVTASPPIITCFHSHQGNITFRNPDGSYLARNDMPNIGLYTGLLIAYCFLLAYAALENHHE